MACDDRAPLTAPKHTNSDTRSDDADGGNKPDEDAGAEQRVATDRGDKSPDAAQPSSRKASDGGSGGAGGHAAGKGGDADEDQGGAGGDQRAHADAGGGGEGGAAGASHAGEGGAGMGGGGGAAAPSGMQSAGGAGAARDPIDVLWELARNTPQGMNAEVIRKYLDALGSGDAPASSIEDFLRSVDDEAHCTQGISQQCVAACQVVARSCGVCLVDEDCRSELVDVCGALTCR